LNSGHCDSFASPQKTNKQTNMRKPEYIATITTRTHNGEAQRTSQFADKDGHRLYFPTLNKAMIALIESGEIDGVNKTFSIHKTR
jgi:hypothetical protein